MLNEVRDIARPWAWRLARLARFTLVGVIALALVFAFQAIFRGMS